MRNTDDTWNGPRIGRSLHLLNFTYNLPCVRSSLGIVSCMIWMVDTADPNVTALWPQEFLSVHLGIMYEMHSRTAMQCRACEN